MGDENVGEGILVVLGYAEDVHAVSFEVVGYVDAAAEVQAGHHAVLRGTLKICDSFGKSETNKTCTSYSYEFHISQ